MSFDERTRLLIGDEGVDRLAGARILVFGLGGVGGYVCEALARAGVGALDIVDNDEIDETNINRQIIATRDTIGREKIRVMMNRIRSINPNCKLTGYDCFYLPDDDSAGLFDFSNFDYVVDAIDTVAAKVDIIARCKDAGTPVISAMGTGNKMDAGRFQIADISKTSVCPLARVMRKELRDRGITDVKVLFSKEEPVKTGQRTPGSISYVPPVAGLLMAGQVIRDILNEKH
ncbi:tRNA threonylcarbamoyladenosine dehydratase [Aminicella lysinilytica]|uniref:tRNA A37 threonylcarbamoyladenosine dehydratase n=1 Tax=Aminicella lysinilytica TaxID=433323 RepID=A0A4R6Q1R2_9FIRM|nr:tRNA threonylcarbamoyladenosine dehydratase [Aminicella lysinilytica]TDP54566.1 tRNA A37 threonylcarbamoyladenosine dehydratase [Aminicella lysinilytica]